MLKPDLGACQCHLYISMPSTSTSTICYLTLQEVSSRCVRRRARRGTTPSTAWKATRELRGTFCDELLHCGAMTTRRTTASIRALREDVRPSGFTFSSLPSFSFKTFRTNQETPFRLTLKHPWGRTCMPEVSVCCTAVSTYQPKFYRFRDFWGTGSSKGLQETSGEQDLVLC